MPWLLPPGPWFFIRWLPTAPGDHDTSLRTTPEALLQLVRDRWSMHDITALLEMAMRQPGPKTR